MSDNKKVRVEVRPITDAQPDPHNANKHTQRGTGLLERSLRKRGFFRPIAAAGKGVERPVVMAGNLTQETAINAGLNEAIFVYTDGTRPIIHVREDLDPDSKEAAQLAIEDNRIAQVSLDWDVDLLGVLDGDVLRDLWTPQELDKLGVDFGNSPEAAEPQIDRAAELQAQWGTETGQMWRLPSRDGKGEHRLICGDCTDRAVVERAMGGEKVGLIVSDPPYGVDYEGGSGNEKKREKLTGDGTPELYKPFLDAAPIGDKCAVYLWHADRKAEAVYAAIRGRGLAVRSQIIWNKVNPHYGAYMAQYKQRHEPCLYAVVGAPEFCGATNECTVWDIEQPRRNENHPTEKPLELFERAIGNHPYQIIYDGFLGSGTTIVAAENLHRYCRAVEISPGYVAVALQRYQDTFGVIPELIGL